VLRVGYSHYNLDSKLREPVKLDDFVLFANKLLSEGNQLFLVVKPEDADSCVNSRQDGSA